VGGLKKSTSDRLTLVGLASWAKFSKIQPSPAGLSLEMGSHTHSSALRLARLRIVSAKQFDQDAPRYPLSLVFFTAPGGAS
jgi:hypothetical protein